MAAQIMEAILRQGGYLAVAVGTFWEGEASYLAAMAAAAQDWLNPWAVALVGIAGALAGDILFFFVGRRWGPALASRPGRLGGLACRMTSVVRKHELPLLLGLRFFYGLRALIPMACGAAGVPAPRFLLMDCISALAWAGVYGLAGYSLAAWLVPLTRGPGGAAWLALAILAILALVILTGRRLRAGLLRRS